MEGRRRKSAPAAAHPPAQRCPLCNDAMTKGRAVKALAPRYNELLQHVTGQGLPYNHIVRRCWEAVREEVKGVAEATVVCNSCHKADEKTILSWDNMMPHDRLQTLPRYYRKSKAFETAQQGLAEPKALCVVCASSPNARRALNINRGTEGHTVQEARYGVGKFGPDLVAYFCHLVYGGKYCFTGQGLEWCSAHYQHLLHGPPKQYVDALEKQQGKAFVNWRDRTCVLCTFKHDELDGARKVGWHLAGGLSAGARARVEDALREDNLSASLHLSLGEPSTIDANLVQLSNIDWICGVCWHEHSCGDPDYAGSVLPRNARPEVQLPLHPVVLAARRQAVEAMRQQCTQALDSTTNELALSAAVTWINAKGAALAGGLSYALQELEAYGIVFTVNALRRTRHPPLWTCKQLPAGLLPACLHAFLAPACCCSGFPPGCSKLPARLPACLPARLAPAYGCNGFPAGSSSCLPACLPGSTMLLQWLPKTL